MERIAPLTLAEKWDNVSTGHRPCARPPTKPSLAL